MASALQKALKDRYKENSFWKFDTFIIREMGFEVEKEIDKDIRTKAYEIFVKKLDGKEPATKPTMRKWFGINGYTRPNRCQIYEIAFYLKLSQEQLMHYLTEGICEPSMQINDYREAIFVYGLTHELSYHDCLEMISDFEWKMGADTVICHNQSTADLLKEFQMKQNLDKDTFMNWMIANAGAFKGYSNTSLKYLNKFKKIVLKQVRHDMREYLIDLLEDTDYDRWLEKRHLRRKAPGEMIRRYIYSNKKIDDETRKEILELVEIVYFEADTNVRLIAEMFATENGKKRQQQSKWKAIRRMTEKYLSDLLNVATQKEREIRAAQAESVLRHMGEEAANELCPAWIEELIKQYSKKANEKKFYVKDAKEWLHSYRKEHKRRCIQVGREDLLPFVLYVAESRYLEDIEFNMENYDAQAAKEEFIELADQTMTACSMMKLSERYELDAALIACFQEDDMYSYAEMLEFVDEM